MNTSSPASPTLDTFLGSVAATVLHEDGSKEEIKISQIKVSQYEKAFPLVDDEFALVGFVCGKDKAWAQTLAPQSYEILADNAQQMNNGFFRYAGRRFAMRAMKDRLTGDKAVSAPPSSGSPPKPR